MYFSCKKIALNERLVVCMKCVHHLYVCGCVCVCLCSACKSSEYWLVPGVNRQPSLTEPEKPPNNVQCVFNGGRFLLRRFDDDGCLWALLLQFVLLLRLVFLLFFLFYFWLFLIQSRASQFSSTPKFWNVNICVRF